MSSIRPWFKRNGAARQPCFLTDTRPAFRYVYSGRWPGSAAMSAPRCICTPSMRSSSTLSYQRPPPNFPNQLHAHLMPNMLRPCPWAHGVPRPTASSTVPVPCIGVVCFAINWCHFRIWHGIIASFLPAAHARTAESHSGKHQFNDSHMGHMWQQPDPFFSPSPLATQSSSTDKILGNAGPSTPCCARTKQTTNSKACRFRAHSPMQEQPFTDNYGTTMPTMQNFIAKYWI